MPRLTAIPPGCAFHPRCPKAFARCKLDRPELIPVDESMAACWLYAGESQTDGRDDGSDHA